MAELVMIVRGNKSGIVDALKMKTRLQSMDVKLSGFIINSDDKERIPFSFIEDMLKLEAIGSLNQSPL